MVAATELWEYDAFISYARFDENVRGFLGSFAEVLRETFQSLTGRPLRLFIDTVNVPASSLWETQILQALQRSATLVIIQSPSYATSTWCGREWDTFLTLEKQRRLDYELLPHESLVFPVRYVSTSHAHSLGPDAARRVKEAQARQNVDLVDVGPDDERFSTRLAALTRDLAAMVAAVSTQRPPPAPGASPSPLRLGESPETAVPLVTTHHGADQRRFVERLSQARSATIISVSDESLPDLVEEAVARKAQTAEGFWDHLNVVFPDDDVLAFINDGLGTRYPDREAALEERKHRVRQVRRRLMSLLLRIGRLGHWTIYICPFAPPFTGAFFSMPDGKRIVQLLISRPKLESDEGLHVNFVDRVDHYFEEAFREVVESSREEHEIVLVGDPLPATREFRCRGARFRRSVLVDGQDMGDWLPALVAITWRDGESGAEPLLQINTPRTSTREIGKVSHVSGYINQRDCTDQVTAAGKFSSDTGLTVTEPMARTALERELLQDFGVSKCPEAPRLVDVLKFHYPDKENLFFYLFEQKLAGAVKYATDLHLLPWSVGDLVTIREHQVYCNVLKTLGDNSLDTSQRNAAADILAMNLRLHGRSDAADALAAEMRGGAVSDALRAQFSEAWARTKRSRFSARTSIYITGIAGLQYRAFFTHLLPTYARIGVRNAAETLDEIQSDGTRSAAMAQLAEAYGDRDLMESLPVEV